MHMIQLLLQNIIFFFPDVIVRSDSLIAEKGNGWFVVRILNHNVGGWRI